MTPDRTVRWACGVGAAGLIAWAPTLPLWTMTMRAPQYPAGLTLSAYGTGMAGDVSELNILNHYIGMPPLHAPALETAVFPFAVIGAGAAVPALAAAPDAPAPRGRGCCADSTRDARRSAVAALRVWPFAEP